MAEKLSDELREKTVLQNLIYKGAFISVRQDRVLLPNGREAIRDLVLHPGAVAILALTDRDSVILVRQYRYPIQAISIELPAGKLEPGEDPDLAAARELGEETGYQATSLERCLSFYSTPGFCDEIMHLYVAKGLTEGDQHPDEDEFVQIMEARKSEVWQMIQDGLITDAKSLVGLLWWLHQS